MLKRFFTVLATRKKATLTKKKVLNFMWNELWFSSCLKMLMKKANEFQLKSPSDINFLLKLMINLNFVIPDVDYVELFFAFPHVQAPHNEGLAVLTAEFVFSQAAQKIFPEQIKLVLGPVDSSKENIACFSFLHKFICLHSKLLKLKSLYAQIVRLGIFW